MTQSPRIYKLALCYFAILQIVIGAASEAFGAAAATRDPGNHGHFERTRRAGYPQSGDVGSAESFNPPAARTNVNQVTDFFDRSIEDKRNVDAEIEKSKQSIHGNIASSAASAELPSNDKAEHEASRLGNISEYELESAGMRTRQSEQCAFYDQNGFEIDHTKPLVVQHKRDMDKIADASEVLLARITQGLRDMGVDCQTVAGNKEQEPEYYVDIEQEPKLDTVYDKFFCEQQRNTYNCNNILTTRCLQVRGKPLRLNITGTNLPLIRHEAGYLQAGSHNGHWLDGGRGTLFNYSIAFNIAKAEAIESLTIGNINYDDFVLIKLNDVHIWSGPFGGHKLELHGGGWRRRVIIDDSGNSHSPENGTWFFAPLNINLKPHLRDGANSLNFTVIVGDKGGLLFDLRMAERECVAWQDVWNEKCTLN